MIHEKFNEKPIHATRCVCGKLIILNPTGLNMRCPLCNTYPTAIDAEKEGISLVAEDDIKEDDDIKEFENMILDELSKKYGAEYVGEFIANGFRFTNLHCNCELTVIRSPKMLGITPKCPFCGTFPTIVGYEFTTGDNPASVLHSTPDFEIHF